MNIFEGSRMRGLTSCAQTFWQVYNNTPFTTLPLRDSLHLFKKNVKPIWYDISSFRIVGCPESSFLFLFLFLLREDSRNKNGGAWIFRVPKANSQEFWKEVLMMAIGEVLQEVVHKGSFYISPLNWTNANWNPRGRHLRSFHQRPFQFSPHHDLEP